MASQSFTITIAPASTPTSTPTPTPTPTPIPPVVSIAPVDLTVTEASPARYNLTVTPRQDNELVVTVGVVQTGEFLTDTAPTRTWRVPANTEEATFEIDTAHDEVDEENGTITVTVMDQDHYNLGSPVVAAVAVLDDDLPVVSIDRNHGTPPVVTEGVGPWFTITASSEPTERLMVKVSVVNTGGSVLRTDEPSERIVEIPAGSSAAASFGVVTLDDDKDEEDGFITATILPGDGYTVSATQSFVIVRVRDNDVPATPTSLRINGHKDGGNVTLRWDFDERVPRYAVRYAAETCPHAERCTTGGWTVIPTIQLQPTSVENTREGLAPLPGLEVQYRVELKAMNVDESDWSESALVYVSNSPPRFVGPPNPDPSIVPTALVGANSVESWQPNGRFHYAVCFPRQAPQNDGEPSMVPNGYKITLFNSIAQTWDAATVWQISGNNIISTLGVESSTCQTPVDGVTRNQVAFYGPKQMELYCGHERRVACWVQTGNLTTASTPSSIVFHAEAEWDTQLEGQCTAFEATLRHEVGHALGFGHTSSLSSIMQETFPDDLCSPTEWDGASLMANYQSR